MSNVSEAYEKVFDKLYRSGVYHLHADFDSLTLPEKHYAFEVTRRFLDICRILHKNWPNTAKYIVAIHGDSILEQIYMHVLDASKEVATLKEATYHSLKQVLATANDNLSTLLLEFEWQVAQGKKIYFIYDTMPNNDLTVLFKTEIDFLNFYHTVDYYRRTSAPSTLFNHIKKINRITYAIYST